MTHDDGPWAGPTPSAPPPPQPTLATPRVDAEAPASPRTIPWVLLRGLARGAGHWGDFTAQWSQALAAPTHAVDLPGNGTLHDRRSPVAVAAMTEAARARLQAAGLEPPYHLLALSLGGMVAVDWAHRHPHELAGAVLVNTSLRRFSRPTQRLQPGAWPTLLGLLRPGLPAWRREQAVARLTTRLIDPAAVVAAWVALHQAHPVSAANVLRQLLAAARYRAPHRAPAVPLLVLASRHDVLVDAACSHRLARHWQVPLVEHPGAGHDLPLDDPAWTIDTVRRWLGQRGALKRPTPGSD